MAEGEGVGAARPVREVKRKPEARRPVMAKKPGVREALLPPRTQSITTFIVM
jgi:hypothetical protein